MQAQPTKLLNLLNGDVQYVVPRWQRRYCWGKDDIERLIEDLLTVASSDQDASHYAGTLLTLQDTNIAGLVNVYRVVDGQQRLTTVSVLLSCIAEALGDDGQIGDWNRETIRNGRLLNAAGPFSRRFKLKLQNEDMDEYEATLSGEVLGSGAVAQAYQIIRRRLTRESLQALMSGLEKLYVVSIGLNVNDDPQQIFETINATGRPLTESEKIKNWLLIGLPEDEQLHLYDNYWKKIENWLNAVQTSDPIDIFLRDFLRWQTGETKGGLRVFDEFRRWAIKNDKHLDRPKLCKELTKHAHLYGLITGTAEEHQYPKSAKELQHLRLMNVDVYRPFALRLLNDYEENSEVTSIDNQLAASLSYVSTWITRLWLAGKSFTSMGKAFAELAHSPFSSSNEEASNHWRERIASRRRSKIGVPSDEEVIEGIASRTAYGSGITKTTNAVFCALMQAEHRTESPKQDNLTIEHIMPQKLTDEWKEYLGEDAEALHLRNKNRLGNLTLCGDEVNSLLGTANFYEKKQAYRKSTIGITKRIAEFERFDEESIQTRANEIAVAALSEWPWQDAFAGQASTANTANISWRINEGEWEDEPSAAQLVLNLTSKLLDLNPENERRLSGTSLHMNIHAASNYPPGIHKGHTMKTIPRHDNLVMDPYDRDYLKCADRCIKLGQRCGVKVQVNVSKETSISKFWQKLLEVNGGLPGQKDHWRGPLQWSTQGKGDVVAIQLQPHRISLYIRPAFGKADHASISRIKSYSFMIYQNFTDQHQDGAIEELAGQHHTINIYCDFSIDDEDQWEETCIWLQDQCHRLHGLIESAESTV